MSSKKVLKPRVEKVPIDPAVFKNDNGIHKVTGHFYGIYPTDHRALRFILEKVLKRDLIVSEEGEFVEGIMEAEDEDMPTMGEAPPLKKTVPKTTPTPLKKTGAASSRAETDIEKLTELAVENKDNYFATPTESFCITWILYVRKNVASQVYKVLRFQSAQPRFKTLKKVDVIDFYLNGRHSNNEVELRSMLLHVPAKDIKLSDIRTKIQVPWFAKDVEMMVKCLTYGDTFYKLLPYFSATVLYKFSAAQMSFLWSILNTCPYVFCFRTYVEKILQLPNSPFRDSKQALQVFVIDPKYSTQLPDKKLDDVDFRDYLLWRNCDHGTVNDQTVCPIIYHPRYPLLSYETVRRLLYKIEKVTGVSEVAPEALYMALTDYVKLESLRKNTGTTAIWLANVDANSEARNFLQNNRIVLEIPGKLYTLECDDHLNEVLADTLAAFVGEHIETYSVEWYNEIYCAKLCTWILAREDLRGSNLFYTHSVTWGTYFAEKCQVTFFPFNRDKITFTELIARQKQLITRNELCSAGTTIPAADVSKRYAVVIEHAQKFSAESLLCMLWKVIDKFQKTYKIPLKDIHLKLVLIGNSLDLPIYTEVGKGDLWRDITNVYPAKPMNFPTGVSIDMRNLKLSLQGMLKTNLNVHTDSKDEKLFQRILEKTRSIKDSTFRIFCSVKRDCNALAHKLDLNKEGNFLENSFYVNDNVGIAHLGVSGIIKKIWEVRPDGTRIEVERTGASETHFASYEYKICLCKLQQRCSCFTIYNDTKMIHHNYVEIISRFQETPFDVGIFYVKENTTLAEAIAVMAYCKQKLFFYSSKPVEQILYKQEGDAGYRKPFIRQSNLSEKLMATRLK